MVHNTVAVSLSRGVFSQELTNQVPATKLLLLVYYATGTYL